MAPNQFAGPRYVAFMADVVGSQDVEDPAAFQQRFVAAVRAAAAASTDTSPLATPIEVTGGDEAKGLYHNFTHAWRAFLDIQAAIHPQRLRIGLGIGPLFSGRPDADARIGALNGDCLIRARKAIEGTTRQQPVRVEADPDDDMHLIESTLSLTVLVRHEWKPKQAQYAYAFGRGQSVRTIAEELGVTDATVSGSLTSSMAHAVHRADTDACTFMDARLAVEDAS